MFWDILDAITDRSIYDQEKKKKNSWKSSEYNENNECANCGEYIEDCECEDCDDEACDDNL